jgi:Ca2+/Na+ antiporter
LVIVDEAHRLRRRVNLGSYFNAFDKASEKLGFDKEVNTELDWVLKQSQKSLLFYDRFQTIKPSDVARTQFEELEHSKGTRMEVLKNQFRSKGGNDFVSFIYDLLDGNSAKLKRFQHPHFELKLFEDLQEMQEAIREQERVHQLSRLVAGYAWEWVSKKNPTQNDIVIGDVELKWNSKNIDWPVMFGASMLFFIWAFDGMISRIEGLMMFLMIIIFTWLIIRNSRRKNKKKPKDESEIVPNIYLSIGKNIVGLVMLYFGSKWLVDGSVDVAKDFGIEERIIGVTVIAVGTSVPELAASVIAAIKKETDISIGNLIGSNIFNILCVIGLTAFIKPIPVSEKSINPDMFWMLGIAFGLGIILFFWKKINRWHGVVMVASYMAYIAILVMSMYA